MLGDLANTGFGAYRAINSDLMQQGLMQQALNQSILDAGRSQYERFTGAPQQSLALPLAALGAAPSQSTQTTTQKPGLFNILSLGLGLL